MEDSRGEVEPVSGTELDRLVFGGHAQVAFEHPARLGKRVRMRRHASARHIRPPRGDHALAFQRAPQRDELQRAEARVPVARSELHDTKRGAPTRMRRASRIVAPAYRRCTEPLGTCAANTSRTQTNSMTTAAISVRFRMIDL